MPRPVPRLNRLLAASRIVAVDTNARGGFAADLAPIAGAVEAIGLTPSGADHQADDAGGYRSLRHATALVGAPGPRTLTLYPERTSLFEANRDVAKAFAREHAFAPLETRPVQTEPLDAAAARLRFNDAAYLRLDAHGAELEALQSAPKLAGETLLCVRVAVAFAPLFKDRPLFGDIDAGLRGKGFVFAGLPALQTWRRNTEAGGDDWAGGLAPLSEGQPVLGEALYLRRPETLAGDTAAEQDRLIAYALLAFAHGQLDLCAATLTRPRVAQRVLEISAIETSVLVADLGKWHARRRRDQIGAAALQHLRDFLRLAAR